MVGKYFLLFLSPFFLKKGPMWSVMRWTCTNRALEFCLLLNARECSHTWVLAMPPWTTFWGILMDDGAKSRTRCFQVNQVRWITWVVITNNGISLCSKAHSTMFYLDKHGWSIRSVLRLAYVACYVSMVSISCAAIPGLCEGKLSSMGIRQVSTYKQRSPRDFSPVWMAGPASQRWLKQANSPSQGERAWRKRWSASPPVSAGQPTEQGVQH